MRVSVVCPVFNTRPEELRAAVTSALAEIDEGGGEILLVDDQSTAEETRDTLADLGKLKGVRQLRTEVNGGPARARNLGLSEARSEWVGFLDADDLWPEGKLSRARAALEARPEAAWIIGDTAMLNCQDALEHRPVHRELVDGAEGSTPKMLCAPALTRWIILHGLSLGACLMRRDRLGEERRLAPDVVYGEDILFLAKLSVAACAAYAAGPSYTFRRQNVSMMWSARRLTADYATGPRAAMRDRELRPYRETCRSWLYKALKELAANNLCNGRWLAGLGFAAQALRLNPREIREFIYFLQLLRLRGTPDLARKTAHYSQGEILALDRLQNSNSFSKQR